MSRQDDIAAAELAGLVGGHLRTIDGSMIQRSSTGDSMPIDPRQFLTKHIPTNKPTTNNNIIPNNIMIEEPKSRPMGSEIVGTETVNVHDLMIPVDGMDNEMREAIKKYSNPTKPVQHPPVASPMVVGSVTPVQSSSTAAMGILEALTRLEERSTEIEAKLDILLKRGKISPRYKAPKTKGSK